MRNCHIENAPCLMAAVELNASCQIVAAAPVYTSEGMITFTPEIESEDGVDYSRLNWAGKRIGPATTGERAEKWWNLTGEIATKDWALFGMLTGNPVVLDGDGNVVGYERPMQRGGVGCGTERKPRAALVIVTAAGISDAGCTVPESGATECVGQFWPLTTSWNIDLAEKSADAPTIKFDADLLPDAAAELAGKTIDEIVEWVGSDPVRAAAALEANAASDNSRKTLPSRLAPVTDSLTKEN